MKKREPISTIMTREVEYVQENQNLKEVMNKFKKYKFRHFPFVNSEKIVVIISGTDIDRLIF